MKNQIPRHRRNDILPYLKRGQQLQIAEKLRVSPSLVSAVLNGRCGQDTDIARNIIRVAQEYTYRNNRYRITKSE